MSADNGVYILKSKDGYRVVHAMAIENLNWWWNDSILYNDRFVAKMKEDGSINPYREIGGAMREELNPRELINYFGRCKVFKTEEEALSEANRIYQEIISDEYCPICEYGICFISGWEDKEFPQMNK